FYYKNRITHDQANNNRIKGEWFANLVFICLFYLYIQLLLISKPISIFPHLDVFVLDRSFHIFRWLGYLNSLRGTCNKATPHLYILLTQENYYRSR
ncbi:MAG TPA: hypothetical protein VN704_05010, partial [Verrucomicrobiae bacterium]|nr:hypothetical protein [Verrucomicrobiae bacterium]